MKKGVCCTCQGTHPVHVRPEETPHDDFDFVNDEREEAEWVLNAHDAFGRYCEGSGTAPQALLHE